MVQEESLSSSSLTKREAKKAKKRKKSETGEKSMKKAKSRLKSKKEEKEELMKQIPLQDENGIAYTKFQIRQMLKRVKKGLAPIATPKELEEKRQNEARLRREEEAELAGLASTRKESDDESEASERPIEEKVNRIETSVDESSSLCPPARKGKRSKPVPSDYVCQACKNKHTPAHWIYDCPDKVTVRGTNQKRKKERGFTDPDSRKVFVSGLPFDVKTKGVEEFFSVTKNCGTVASVRLVKFGDTGRCNGQAYVSFDTEQGAKRAIQLSGTMIDSEALSSSPDGKSSKKKDTETTRKQLKLKVSKVLNRNKTKRN